MEKDKDNSKNSLSKKNIKLLLYVFGILIFIASYAGLRPGQEEKREELTAENEQLNSKLQQLLDLEANEAAYMEQSKLFEEDIADIIDRYPPNVKEEDIILYARDLTDGTDISISVIGMSPANLMYSLGMSSGADETYTEDAAYTEEAAADDTGLGILDASQVVCPDYNLYGMSITYDFTASYDDMKSLLARIMMNRNKRNVSALSMTFDSESGMIIGNMNVNMYYLTGTEKVYQEPNAGVVEKGNNNIFNTIGTN